MMYRNANYRLSVYFSTKAWSRSFRCQATAHNQVHVLHALYEGMRANRVMPARFFERGFPPPLSTQSRSVYSCGAVVT